MIEIRDLVKNFGSHAALKGLNTEFKRGTIYGLVGANGSGKSTFLRHLAGVYYSDSGEVKALDQQIYDNPAIKNKIFFVSDDLYFLPGATVDDMAAFYSNMYPKWDASLYLKLGTMFPIPKNKKINTFSKGMKRQAALILALSARPDCLLLDEAFDGLDPVVRFSVRRVIADQILEDNMLVVISSHNLRELEDFCDAVGLLHEGRMLMEFTMDNMKSSFVKVHAAFKNVIPELKLDGIRVVSQSQTGGLITLICQAKEEDIIGAMEKLNPAFVEAVPLTLEEVFVYEMEAAGYGYAKVLF